MCLAIQQLYRHKPSPMRKDTSIINYSSLMLLLLILFCTHARAQVYYPAATWETRSPASMGFDEVRLREAIAFAEANEYKGSRDLRIATLESFAREPYHVLAGPTKKRGGPAGIIIRKGYIVAQWGDVERVDMTFSVTKSFLSTVAGLAYDRRLIQLDEPVVRWVWDGTFDGEHNSRVTWRHLLTQSSDWSGTLFDMHDWADRPPRDGGLDDWKNRKLNDPGAVFEYNDVRINVLAYSLLQVLRKPLPAVLKENIMDPIGASTTWRWYGYDNSWVNVDGVQMQSVSGGGHSGGGMFISTTDMARFGYLFLRRGNWNGKTLISEDWIRAIQQPSAANPSYGLTWWLNKGDGKWEGVPETVYHADGFGGNFIVIDAAHDLVIVTRWLEPSKIGEMVKQVVGAVK
jgi:CubicO group peptidase (beta-lactamase class C family)